MRIFFTHLELFNNSTNALNLGRRGHHDESASSKSISFKQRRYVVLLFIFVTDLAVAVIYCQAFSITDVQPALFCNNRNNFANGCLWKGYKTYVTPAIVLILYLSCSSGSTLLYQSKVDPVKHIFFKEELTVHERNSRMPIDACVRYHCAISSKLNYFTMECLCVLVHVRGLNSFILTVYWRAYGSLVLLSNAIS